MATVRPAAVKALATTAHRSFDRHSTAMSDPASGWSPGGRSSGAVASRFATPRASAASALSQFLPYSVQTSSGGGASSGWSVRWHSATMI